MCAILRLRRSRRRQPAGQSHGAGSVMTFTGSAATATGGRFGEFASRIDACDPNLRFLPPPRFPSIDDTYTTAFFRGVAP